MTKAQLRHHYKELRKDLDPDEKLSREARLFQELRSSFDLTGKAIHIYLPIKRLFEIDTYPLLQDDEVNWVISKTDFENLGMKHFHYTPEIIIRENHWGIPEPIEGQEVDPLDIDVVLTPLLCFDLSGNRVGYGKGFYDRFFASCRPDVTKIGLSLFEPTEVIDNTNAHDVRLSAAITPANTYYFH